MKTLIQALAALACALVLLAAPPAQAARTLYTIGSDAGGIGRLLVPIAPSGAAVALGDGSLAFDGGLAWSAGTWSAIANDSLGRSSLVTFADNAPAVTLSSVPLGSGFFGGLAHGAGGDLFAIGADAAGLSSLYRVGTTSGSSLVGTLGFGVTGLGFDPLDGRFYALAADATGVPRTLERIDLGGSGGLTTSTLFTLGDGTVGFLGGLTWDDAAARFVTVGSDAAGLSTLYGFDLTGSASLTALQPLGTGALHGGLAFASPVPEPAAAWLMLAGGVALVLVGARRPILFSTTAHGA